MTRFFKPGYLLCRGRVSLICFRAGELLITTIFVIKGINHASSYTMINLSGNKILVVICYALGFSGCIFFHNPSCLLDILLDIFPRQRFRRLWRKWISLNVYINAGFKRSLIAFHLRERQKGLR